MHRDNIARAVALSYLFLGGYYLQNIVDVDAQTIACASVAAFILVGADAFRSWLEKHVKSDNGINIVHAIIEGINTVAFVVLLVCPFGDFDLSKSRYEDIGTASSLAGLGISIYLLAKKSETASEQKNKDRDEKILQIFKESKRLNDEAKAINAETKIFMSSYNKELNEQINAIINNDTNRKD